MAKNEAQVASLNPDDMLAGGLKSNFRGKITEAVYAPWDYQGNIAEPVLGVRLTVAVDGEEAPLVQHWPAGDLAAFVPSQDGKNPTDGEGMELEPGPYALKVGSRTQLNNNSNFAHLMQTIIDAGEASGKFKKSNLTASLECLEGLDAFWDRVPQKKRSGLIEDTDGPRKGARDILVVTEVFGYREAKGKTGTSKPGAAKSTKPEPEAESLDDKLQTVVMEALAEAPNNSLKKGKLATEVLKRMAKDKDKSKAIKRCSEQDFLDGGPWAYDEDTATLSL